MMANAPTKLRRGSPRHAAASSLVTRLCIVVVTGLGATACARAGNEAAGGDTATGGVTGAAAAARVSSLPAVVDVQQGVTAVFLQPSAGRAAERSARWSIAGGDAARLSIDPATGALAFRQAPDTAAPGDAEGHNNYHVVVQLSDGRGSAQTSLTIHVLPWNDGGAAQLPLPLAPQEVPRPAARTGKPGLKVLDWAGFQAAVSYTFDDSQPSQIDHYPALKAQRVRVTYYINPTANRYPQPDDPTRFDAIWRDAVAQGSEIGNHTTHHCRVAELTDNNPATCRNGLGSAGAEFDDTTEYIRTKIGQADVWTAAYPFGDMDYRAAAASRFLLARGVWPGMVPPGAASDALNLPVIGFDGDPSTPGGDPLARFTTAVDNAVSQRRWMIYLFHTLLPTTQNWFAGERIDVVTGNMAYAKSLGTVWIDSVVNIGAYWRGQQLLEQAAATTTGSVTTWRWTLPAHFPPGRKLRVVVDGGTLWQNGKPLHWNRRGYYELALDAQSLSWTPGSEHLEPK
jgi:peptidoglycan/xylan/chitin deacetylase (PgdA/CDA1 family)